MDNAKIKEAIDDIIQKYGYSTDPQDIFDVVLSHLAKVTDEAMVEELLSTTDPLGESRPFAVSQVKAIMTVIAPILAAREQQAVEKAVKQTKQNTWCAYCGKEFPLDTVTADQVGEHIATCEKHPLYQAKKSIAELKTEMAEAVKAERERIVAEIVKHPLLRRLEARYQTFWDAGEYLDLYNWVCNSDALKGGA